MFSPFEVARPMCHLCYVIGARPRVITPCGTCHGLSLSYDGADCPDCHGRAFTSHEVSFDCLCDGCREFRGEDVPPGRVTRQRAAPEIEAALFLPPTSTLPQPPTLSAG